MINKKNIEKETTEIKKRMLNRRKIVNDIKKGSDIRLKGEEKKVLIKENISKVKKKKRKAELTRGVREAKKDS